MATGQNVLPFFEVLNLSENVGTLEGARSQV